MSRRKTLMFAFFGIAIGLCIGTVFKNYRALEIVKKCNIRLPVKSSPIDVIGLPSNNTIYNSQKNLVFIGVMTAKSFLNGRAKAVYDTWGKEVPGKLAFFSSEGSKSDELPVIALKNVDDRYPPQKKSFMMLMYFYVHFIDKFEWFIRADDDVYMDVKKLEKFLRSIDSSKPKFIGQAGKGNSEEFGLLSLEYDENFCMGGPGVILSRETLRRVAPHIPTCLKNLYSTHEDVEIGRCVQKYAGVPCTWNYEMQYILRHNSSGKNAFTTNLKRKEIHNAITLHPVKQSPLMYRLHTYIQGLRADELRQEALLLHRDIRTMSKHLQLTDQNKFLVPGVSIYPNKDHDTHFDDHNILGVSPDLNKFTPKSTEDLLSWDYISRSLYSADHTNPKRKIDSASKESLEETITEVMEYINNFSRQRGRVIEFRELLYGYSRLNPMHGNDLILDLLLIYKKYRGKKMTVPVRRHLYVQRSFTGIFISSEPDGDIDNRKNFEVLENSNHISNRFKNILSTGFEKLSNSLNVGFNFKSTVSKIVFIVPVYERYEIFKRFLDNYNDIAIQSDKNCDLLIVIFGSSQNIKSHLELLMKLRKQQPFSQLNYINLNGSFSRGVALNIGSRSAYVQNNDIILFIDLDMQFNQLTLDRIRLNTIQGKQIYTPIVFSEYKYRNENLNSTDKITDENGYFRQYGFGTCSIYKSDILDPEINGFDKNINGWGLEDVKFLEKIINIGNRKITFLINTSEVPNYNVKKIRKLNVFRSADPSLIHIYHDIKCENLENTQYNMCLGTKANTLSSTKFLENLFFSNKNNIDFIAEYNLNHNRFK